MFKTILRGDNMKQCKTLQSLAKAINKRINNIETIQEIIDGELIGEEIFITEEIENLKELSLNIKLTEEQKAAIKYDREIKEEIQYNTAYNKLTDIMEKLISAK